MIEPQTQELVLEAEAGLRTHAEIAAEYEVSDSLVRHARKRARRVVDQVELDLTIAAKTGEQIAVLIPFGPDHLVGVQFGTWVCDELRERGVTLRVETRTVANGLLLILEDATPYRKQD